jgi:hypothetical protein
MVNYNIYTATKKIIMNDSVELYCTQNEKSQWLVWFPRLLGGMNVLETFDNEAEARVYWQEQLDSADLGDQK